MRQFILLNVRKLVSKCKKKKNDCLVNYYCNQLTLIQLISTKHVIIISIPFNTPFFFCILLVSYQSNLRRKCFWSRDREAIFAKKLRSARLKGKFRCCFKKTSKMIDRKAQQTQQITLYFEKCF